MVLLCLCWVLFSKCCFLSSLHVFVNITTSLFVFSFSCVAVPFVSMQGDRYLRPGRQQIIRPEAVMSHIISGFSGMNLRIFPSDRFPQERVFL